jgi:hypothetical protein
LYLFHLTIKRKEQTIPSCFFYIFAMKKLHKDETKQITFDDVSRKCDDSQGNGNAAQPIPVGHGSAARQGSARMGQSPARRAGDGGL